MARKTSKRAHTAAARTPFQPQDLLFAGIGAVSLGRKQVLGAYANGFQGVSQIGNQIQDATQDLVGKLNGKVVALRKQAKAKAAPVQKKVQAVADQARAELGKRLAPTLAKFGVKPAPAKRAAPRKKAAAGKKTTTRARKAA
jgi:hypothetical protein